MTLSLWHVRGLASSWRVMAIVAFASLTLAATPATARAHARFERAEPAPNAVLASSPARIEVWFSGTTEPASYVALWDAQEQRAGAERSSVAGIDQRVVVLELPEPLPPGVYRVAWYALANDDGHETSGEYRFTIDPAATPSSGDVALLSPTQQAFLLTGGAIAATLAGMWFVSRRTTRPD